MATAVDSSILLDVLTDDPSHRATSHKALYAARQAGARIVCPIVWAEVSAFFEDPEGMARSLDAAGIRFNPFDRACAEIAGEHPRAYRRNGGSRTRLLADFLIWRPCAGTRWSPAHP